jgi:hypothetical protein
MKITIVLLLLCMVQLNAETYSQTITLSGKDLPMERVMSAIREQTSYGIAGGRTVLSHSRPVSISAKDMPLDDFLKEVFRNQPIGYRMDGRTIFLSQKALPRIVKRVDAFSIEEEEVEIQQRIISGLVTDSLGTPLEGASIALKARPGQGTSTNAQGQYFLELQDPDPILVFSMVGFRTKEVSAGNQSKLNVVLSRDTEKRECRQCHFYGQPL